MMPPDRFLRLTVAAIVTALTGLIVVQVMLLKDAFALKQETFRQSVSGALSAAAVRLATGETQDVVFRTEKDSLNRTISAGSSAWSVSGECTVPPGPQARRDSLAHRDGTPSLMRIQVITTGDKDSLLLDSSRLAGRRARPAGTPAAAAQGFMYRYETDSVKTVVRVGGDVSRTILTHSGNDRRRQVFVARVIDNLRVSSRRPLEDRISRSAVDSALRRSFTEAGITLEYASGVLDRDDSLHFAQPHEASQDLHMSPYRTALFLDDGPQNRLVVSFPGQRLFLLQQLWPVLLASLVFLVLIVAGFAAGFRTIVRQHQLGRSMVDFINNMTHEFKTPLSTVMLATEAIQRPDVIGKKTRVMKYNSMIAEETLRMKGQVGRILSLAQLEEGEVTLQSTDIEMHALLEDAVRGFAVQAETRGGRVSLDLRADRTVVRGDRVHLLNIIHGVLDNANKYSPDSPRITVATANDHGFLNVRISDQGKGIPEELHDRVFEKYYRVPTGNLHEVKGFGIGLSYVKRTVELHGGKVELESRPGTGTTVTMKLPLASDRPENQ